MAQTGLQVLVDDYANGLDCQRGAQKALGKNLTRLEYEWQRDVLSKDVTAAVINNLLPWLVLLSIILLTPLILLARWLRAAASRRTASQQAP